MSSQDWDVFISYAREDGEWVETLAENLCGLGLDVFKDDWEIDPGDVLAHKIDSGVMAATNGVLVVTPAALSRPWVREEYAAMITRAVENGFRLVPVLLADAEMPALLASRVWIDFRDAYGPEYEKKVRALARVLKGRERERPPAGGGIAPPRGDGFRPEGPIHRTLRIGRERVEFLGGWKTASHRPRGIHHEDENRLYELERLRHGDLMYRDRGGDAAAATMRRVDRIIRRAGAALTRAFLEGEAGEALRRAVGQASSLNASLRLALDISDSGLFNLPWETLRIPDGEGEEGEPLVLHPNVLLYRSLPGGEGAPAIRIPGPLRILVAIGSPEEQNERGELLNMERETARILDSVERARESGKAHVRVLETGSVHAIREALNQERYHILHISCHAEPGALILEDDQGKEDRVTTKRFCEEALPPDRGVPLVVLAGCSTGIEGKESEEEPFSAVGRGLIEHGAPAVAAMQAPVTDFYATEFCGALYHNLAANEHPAPLTAIFEARRNVERLRLEHSDPLEKIALTGWPIPALFLRGKPLPLYDPGEAYEKIEPPVELTLDGVCVRKVGDFVGRRMDQRVLSRELRGDSRAVVVIHGIGGVGKSSLAAQVLHRLHLEGRFLISLTGEISVHAILETLGQRLLELCYAQGVDETHPIRQIANALKQQNLEWETRFGIFRQNILAQMELFLLLDNFEDNLNRERGVKDEILGELLALWAKNPGKSRLVFTSRYPFSLPDSAEAHLKLHHLGPLSLSETRKLVWNLHGLNALKKEGLVKAYASVGGHPRALEYLDAILRGGEARFTDVTRRLTNAIREKGGIDDPARWCRNASGDLESALAETVTIAADEVLMDDLLETAKKTPMAPDLLVGASVFRQPVESLALAWLVGEEIEIPADPARDKRMVKVQEAIKKTLAEGKEPTPDNLGLTQKEVEQYKKDMEEKGRPPIAIPNGIDNALKTLLDLSLLSLVKYAEDQPPRFLVHRWTAGALESRFSRETLQEAHHKAGRYWTWRVVNHSHDIDEHIEARFHFYQAGEVDTAVSLTWTISHQLNTWWAWQREEALLKEALTWIPEDSRGAAKFTGDLANIAQRRGAYEEAMVHYQNILAIFKKLKDKKSIASIYHNMGAVSEVRGSYDDAMALYRKSLGIKEELGNRAGMASSYHQMGNVSDLRGSYDEAMELYRKALEINEELGNRAGIASSLSQMGILLTENENVGEGVPFQLKSLAIRLDLEVPEISVDLHWLTRQRELLGEEEFGRIVEKEVGEEQAEVVFQLLQQYAEIKNEGVGEGE